MNEVILIIEANRAIQENTAELLLLKNYYHVLTAENGRTGFEIVKQHHPDLIICDLVIPSADVYTFLQLAKENTSIYNIPLIFLDDNA